MARHQTTRFAVDHLLEGQVALADVEAAGVRIDMAYIDKAMADIEARNADTVKRLHSHKRWREWKREFGDRANLSSRDQLSEMVFQRWGYAPVGVTAGGQRYSATKESLAHVHEDFVKDILRMDTLTKARNTWLRGIRREALERDGCWYVHPTFNLNVARTFRSSCSSPNLQNVPVRDAEVMKVIRRAFIPRKGHHFCEPDYSQIEVRVSACYNHDPKLIRYLTDKSSDMHRDSAIDIFNLGKKVRPEYWKEKGGGGADVRHTAKNMYVFPQFYGSVYFQCAPAIWDAMKRRNLKAPDGTPMRKHLRLTLGITELGDCDPKATPGPHTFVAHMRRVEDAFWTRLKVYKRWKYDWYDKYQRDGGMSSLFGFAWNGVLSRNEVLNFAIQGDSFNLMLWSLCRLVKRLRKYRMKSLVVGQIHDSMQQDNHRKEVGDVLDMTRTIMIDETAKQFPWLAVPLEVESDVAPLGHSWAKKAEWVKHDGAWGPKS